MYGKKRLEESRANIRRDLDNFLSIVNKILQKDRLFHV